MQKELEELKMMTAPQADPKLTAPELQSCLDRSRVVDKNGKSPSETGWIPTYNLDYAAALAWETKAAKASEYFGFKADEQQFSPEKIYDHCQQMARKYRNRLSGSIDFEPKKYV